MTEPTRDALHEDSEERETEATTQWLLREARRSGRTPFEMDNLRYAAECVKRVPELEAEVERLRAKAAIVDAIEGGAVSDVGRTPRDFPAGKRFGVLTDRQWYFGESVLAAYAAATREGAE